MHQAIVAWGGYLEVGSMLDRRAPSVGRELLIGSKEELLEETWEFVR